MVREPAGPMSAERFGAGLRVYAFVEAYPHEYKPYYDVQFADLASRGCELDIFCFARGRTTRGRAERTHRMLPDELRAAIAWSPRALASIARRPTRAWTIASSVWSFQGDMKDRLKDVIRGIVLAAREPDICLVHGLGPMSALPFLRAIYPGAAMVGYYHGEKAHDAGLPNDERVRSFLRSAHLTLSNSTASAARATARGAPTERCKVLPVGFDLGRYALASRRGELPAKPETIRLLSVGRLSEEKGFTYALEAIAALPASERRRVRYTIVGDGRLRGELIGAAQRFGIADRIQVTGTLPHKAVLELLANSDVLLVPSVLENGCEETQATVIQEAALLGTVSIASSIGGIPESTPPTYHDFLVPQRDATAIADTLLTIMRAPRTDLAARSAAARDWTAARYDIRALNGDLLHEALAARS